MKIKTGFVLRKVADNYVVVAVGEASKHFNGIINLNSTGAFVWNCFTEDTTIDNVVNKVLDEYNIDEETATSQVNAFANKLKEANILE